MLGVAALAAVALALTACATPTKSSDHIARRYELTQRSDVLVLDAVPEGATVLGDIETDSPLARSAVPSAMGAAVRRAAEMGANAVVVESDEFDSDRKREFVRVKAIRITESEFRRWTVPDR